MGYESDEAIILKAELPGFSNSKDKDGVHIELHDNRLARAEEAQTGGGGGAVSPA
jgi:HSP20 family molecular chaperone IbpA